MYVCMRIDETKWLAGKSDATSWSWSDLQKQALHLGEVMDMTYYCGTAAMYVELALGRHWREEQWSRTPTTNTLQLESATC